MHQLSVAIVSPFEAALPKAELVIFAGSKHFVAEDAVPEMIARAKRYAAKNRIFLVTERFLLEDYLCACMLAPNGSLMGIGQATHLNLGLRQNNISRSDEVSVFDTPFGKTALLVDVDINMPQVCRAAVRMGAELILSTEHIPLYDLNENRISCGAVNAAASNGVWVVAAVGAGGVIADRSGHITAGYTDSLPLVAEIEAGASVIDRRAMRAAHELLIAHRELIDEPREAKSDE